MYVTDYTIEMPIIVRGQVVSYANDVDCIISVDERCDLVKVGFRPWALRHRHEHKDTIWITRDSAGDDAIIFQSAVESLKRCKSEIADLCGVPLPAADDDNEYTDPRFRPVSLQRITF